MSEQNFDHDEDVLYTCTIDGDHYRIIKIAHNDCMVEILLNNPSGLRWEAVGSVAVDDSISAHVYMKAFLDEKNKHS